MPTRRRSGLRMFIVRTNEQRVIGMLGGMSWESSAQYYRLANEIVRERLGGLHSARCLLASVDFADIETLQVAGRWEEAGQMLGEAARGLEAGGADVLLRCADTMHKVDDQVQAAVNIPLLHLGRRHRASGDQVRVEHRGSARHRVHHGAGVLPRPARQPRAHRAHPTGRRPDRGASLGRVEDPVLTRLPLVGAVDQLLDCTDVLASPVLTSQMRCYYDALIAEYPR
jgi:Asp/Glu/Hydantoin racemase